MKKKILFVINTLSRAGAETALLELLAQLAAERGEDGQPRYELSLFVLMNQGELVQQIPEGVRLVNPRYAQVSVLEPKGRIYMGMTVVKCLLHRANLIRLWRYHWRAARAMRKEGRLMPDKLLWRAISDGARRFPEEYDLAVAFLGGRFCILCGRPRQGEKKGGVYPYRLSEGGIQQGTGPRLLPAI